MVQYKLDKYAGTELPVTANMYWQISIGAQVERGPEEGFQMEWIWTIWVSPAEAMAGAVTYPGCESADGATADITVP